MSQEQINQIKEELAMIKISISSLRGDLEKKISVIEAKIENMLENGRKRDKWTFFIISLLLGLFTRSFL